MSLDRVPSQVIVTELVRVLGEVVVLDLLDVNAARLKALGSGRGRLQDAQLLRITNQTGRSWMRWGVDPIARGERTVEQKRLDVATYQLLDKIDPIKNGASKANGHRKTEFRRGSKMTQRQAI